MPLDNEFLIEDLLVVKEFHEGSGVNSLIGILPDKVLDDGLQKMLNSNFPVLFN